MLLWILTSGLYSENIYFLCEIRRSLHQQVSASTCYNTNSRSCHLLACSSSSTMCVAWPQQELQMPRAKHSSWAGTAFYLYLHMKTRQITPTCILLLWQLIHNLCLSRGSKKGKAQLAHMPSMPEGNCVACRTYNLDVGILLYQPRCRRHFDMISVLS